MKNKTNTEIMKAYNQCLIDVHNDVMKLEYTKDYYNRDQPRNIITDDQFNFKTLLDYNDELNIDVAAKTANNDHITKKGNRLGIIDRMVRTMKNNMNKVICSNKGRTNIKQVIKQIVENYNDTPHKSL